MNTAKKEAFSTQDHAQYIIDNCIVVDTETTGLGEKDVAIELAAVNAKTGQTIIDTLMRCSWGEIPTPAYNVHGIGINDLQSAPHPSDVISLLTHSTDYHKKQLTAFNMSFDSRIIKQTSPLNSRRIDSQFGAQLCVMELANRHFVKDHGVWKHGQSQFGRLSLAKCCEIAGIEFKGKAHRAMADVLATIDLLHYIANDR